MKYFDGIHFYISIINFDDAVEAEEDDYNTLVHSIHLLNSFFSGIERFSKTNCDNIEIEKITSGRIHLYSVGTIEDTINDVLKVCYFAYCFSKQINEVGKYKSLPNIRISIGASFGGFFVHDVELGNEITENTSIGYACNFAAKLQSVAGASQLAVDSDICNSLRYTLPFIARTNERFKKKYNQSCYYTLGLSQLSFCSFVNQQSIDSFIEKQIEYLNDNPLSDMKFTDTNKRLDFDSLNINDGRRFVGIPFYSDVRDFTSKFTSTDSNLSEMAFKVVRLMKSMFDIVKEREGTHIQFQGDREFAVFVTSESDIDSLARPVLAGLKIIDQVPSDIGLSVGVGMSFGKLYATRVGIRNNKDNILIGRIVNEANENEDLYASKNQVVISKEIYDVLKKGGREKLCSVFKQTVNGLYCTDCGYKRFITLTEKKESQSSYDSKSYNGAWRKHV